MAKTKKYISSEDLAAHNTPGDLWISIHGKVYDVSDWAHRHPGGELPLVSLAGKDATDAFVAYHTGHTWHYLNNFHTGFHLSDYTVSDVSRDYRNLAAHSTRFGLFDQKGHVTSLTFCAVALMFFASVYGILYSNSTLVHSVSAVLMGFSWMQSGWIGHDSGHYRVVTSPRLNHLLHIFIGNCVAGISIGWWRWNHNAHHIACNSLDFDPDVQHMPFFAVSSKLFASLRSSFYERVMSFDSASRFLVSHQHWTFYPVMCISRLYLLTQSLAFLFSKRKVPNRGQEILCLAVFWIWYPLLVSYLPNWGERVMFVLLSFSVTGIQQVQFCLNHFSSSVYVGPPNGNDWFEKQTNGTLNIGCSSWMDWFHGGLQFQIEHHLFPRLPRCQLRKISPFVAELCKKHNLPYNSASFLKANIMTVNTLRTAALEARDLTNPIPKNLVWEAVNTHG